jgi:two-component system alkaline phosphatase synthesis response regulator PhoP
VRRSCPARPGLGYDRHTVVDPSPIGRSVLVVDDYEDARTLYAEAFQAAGWEVSTAANGEDAVEIALDRHPEAIVMDLQLPVLDGWQATRRIRAALGAKPYIVAVTAHSGEFSRTEAYHAGCDDVLAKPLGPDVLVGIVATALRDRASR